MSGEVARQLGPEVLVDRRGVSGEAEEIGRFLPLSEFIGVSLRLSARAGGSGFAATVLLERRNGGFPVPLSTSEALQGARQAWIGWGRALGLPLLAPGECGRLQTVGFPLPPAQPRRRGLHAARGTVVAASAAPLERGEVIRFPSPPRTV